jgi:hypothetical protein
MTRIGDRQRYPLPNQRFSKQTAQQLTALYEQSLSRFVGSITGRAWGCVSAPQLEASYVTGPPPEVRINVGKCLFLQSISEDGVGAANTDYGPWVTKLVLHDPDRGVQTTSSIDVTAFAPTALGGGGGTLGQRCWLLFRRQEAPSDFDNEVYWDTTSDSEAAGADNLLIREFVEFAAVATIPNTSSAYGEANGWFRFAYIPFWSDPGGPTICPIHWVHSTYFSWGSPPINTGLQSALAPGGTDSWDQGGNAGFTPDLGMPSVGKLLHWLMMKVGQHVDPVNVQEVGRSPLVPLSGAATGAVLQAGYNANGWLSVPARGLTQLDTDVAALEARNGVVAHLRVANTGTLGSPVWTVTVLRAVPQFTLTAGGNGAAVGGQLVPQFTFACTGGVQVRGVVASTYLSFPVVAHDADDSAGWSSNEAAGVTVFRVGVNSSLPSAGTSVQVVPLRFSSHDGTSGPLDPAYPLNRWAGWVYYPSGNFDVFLMGGN